MKIKTFAAVLGAFLVGVAVGNSPRFRHSTREVLEQVVTFVLAPMYFGSIALNVSTCPNFAGLMSYNPHTCWPLLGNRASTGAVTQNGS